MSVTTLVDPQNELGRTFGYRAIPNGFAFGPDGTLIGSKVPGFDIRDAGSRDLLERWLATSSGGGSEPAAVGAQPPAAQPDLFAEGSRLMRDGQRSEGLAAWVRAFQEDPGNFVIRKQIWRALYPERFGEPIDLAWQKEQMAREDGEGFIVANPGLPLAATEGRSGSQ